MGKSSISFTNANIGDDERRYLRSLPAHIRLEFQFNHTRMNLLLVHGSPRKNNEYLFEDREEKSMLRIMEQADADILCFGHTHKPFHRILMTESQGNTRYRHAINIGSVGKPKDNNPQGCYALLTINPYAGPTAKDVVEVQLLRFDYDVEKAATAIENSPLPKQYADMLRKGY